MGRVAEERALGLALVIVVVGTVGFILWLADTMSTFGDRSPAAVIMRNETSDAVVFFLCDSSRPISECRGRRVPPRATATSDVRNVGHDEERFDGTIFVTTVDCRSVSKATGAGSGDMAVVIGPGGVELRTGISPYSERYAPGYEVLGWAPPDATCPSLDAADASPVATQAG